MKKQPELTTLGIDLGSNSLGWCLIETAGEPCSGNVGRIIALGSRIFSDGRDPKSKASLAVDRRQARAARRRRERYVRRRTALLALLTKSGLMPADDQARKQLLRDTGDAKGGDVSMDVYALRAKALDHRLHPHQIGRILFQLDQRRGFKSNRRTDRGDNDAGKIATGVARLDMAMADQKARTYGEFLHQRRLNGQSVRTRLRPEAAEGTSGDGYDFYPSRDLLEAEFDAICAAQRTHHPDQLDEETIAKLRDITFFQRPLKTPQPGKCSYNNDELRLAKAHPLFQTFRLYKEVNELALIGEDQTPVKLTVAQRDALILKLRTSKSASFAALRKFLKIGSEYRFNKETETRSKLLGDEVCADLSNRTRFGNGWASLSTARQWEIIQRLRDTEDPQSLVYWLQNNAGLTQEQAEATARLNMPIGYGRIGHTALCNLLDALKNEVDEEGRVITEAEAAKRCGYHHSDKSDPDFEGYDCLPPYQEVLEQHIPPGTGNPKDIYDIYRGRITNPSVHIALNQLRRLINEIIGQYGKPDKIAVELVRDLKLSDREKEEIRRTQARNTQAAEMRSAKLAELGLPDTGYNRLRLHLWEELNEKSPENRLCVYSGEPISISTVFTPDVDVDHILPYSRTLDDSRSNKILCKAHSNRQKRNRAPSEVTEWQAGYENILARARALPRGKQWRFANTAMDRSSEENGFLARQLTDTQYMTRLALSYLAALYPTEEADETGLLRRHKRVRALPGRTTEMVRRHWGLNDLLQDHNYSETTQEKNRSDHRHHAIDALVIACTSESMIQNIARASAQREAEGAERVVARSQPAWPSLREELRGFLRDAIVSHKADHGRPNNTTGGGAKRQTTGKLHNDTAYGPTQLTDSKGAPIVVRRKAIAEFSKYADLAAIRDEHLKTALQAATAGLGGKDFEQAVLAFSKRPGIYRNMRRIRILETLKTIGIRDRNGIVYKSYKGDSNDRFEVWQMPDGKWIAGAVTTFEANQLQENCHNDRPHPAAKKVLKLRQHDMLAIDLDGTTSICRVVKFGQSQIVLAPHHEAGALKKRDAELADPFRYINRSAGSLKRDNARQVRIDLLGRIFDPGPLR